MDRMRMMLFGVLMMGMGGTLAELLLTGHYEDVWQKAPVVLLVIALGSTAMVALTGRFVPGMRLNMALLMAAGALGTYFHYESNAEFAVELTPGLSGFALMAEALTRPTPPPLAPGTMIMLGLLGLVCCYRIGADARAQGE